jgi:hypothetical protein
MVKELSIKQSAALESLYNSVVGFLPGGHVIQELAEFRSKIQQERLNRFSDYLKEGFEKISGKVFDPENLKSEDFLDSFEIIVRKVVLTRSKEKLLRYRNILLRKMFVKQENELFDKFVSMLEQISDSQLLILSNIGVPSTFRQLVQTIFVKGNNTTLLVKFWNDGIRLELINGAKITNDEFRFFLHDLRARDFITEQQRKDDPYETNYLVTRIGSDFLNFISDYNGS